MDDRFRRDQTASNDCQVESQLIHFMRNALAYAGRTQRRIVSAWGGTAFAQDDATAARKQWRAVADQARPRVPKLAALMDEAEADVLAYMGFPTQHRTKLHSTDEIDKPFRRDLLSLRSTGDRA